MDFRFLHSWTADTVAISNNIFVGRRINFLYSGPEVYIYCCLF